VAAAAPAHGFFQSIAGMFFSPREEFASILPRAAFWMPLVCWMALGLLFTTVWTQKVDVREFIRGQIEQSGRADKIPPGQMESVLDTQSKIFKPIAWGSAVLAPPILVLVVGGLYLFVFRFFYGGEVTLGQSMSVVAWSYFTMALETTPLLLLVMSLKGDWNVNPQEAIQANAAMFFERATTAKPLYALASSLDLFSFWVLWLLSSGYGAATRRPTASAAGGVVALWAIYVLGKAAFAAIF
jgi:hypothetical protein